jgi:hypothetical protein
MAMSGDIFGRETDSIGTYCCPVGRGHSIKNAQDSSLSKEVSIPNVNRAEVKRP